MIDDLTYIVNATISTIFVCAGIFFLILAVIGEISGKFKLGKSRCIASGVIGIFFLCIGLHLSGLCLPYPFAPTITVEITSPQEDTIIPSEIITVKGKASNVPEDKYLWVITKQQEGDNKFYPRDGRILIYEDTWNVEIWLATQDKKYSIFACLANKTANDNLTNYADTRKQKGDPGMRSLPKGVKTYDRINVTWSAPE